MTIIDKLNRIILGQSAQGVIAHERLIKHLVRTQEADPDSVRKFLAPFRK